MRIFVVVKRTAQRLYGRDPLVKRLVARLRRAHDDHEATVREVREAVRAIGAKARFFEGSRSLLEEECDLVVTVGGDGTLLGASHQIGHVPVLGINSAPADSVGFFCGAEKGRVLEALRGAASGTLPRVELARMRVELNGALVHDRVLNEALFCHELPAGTSRYILRLTQRAGDPSSEEQKSSGVWVGPAAGSTAAQRSAGGRVLPLTSRRLQFVVREAYVPRGERLRLRRGEVDDGGSLELLCKMRSAKVFLDGIHIVASCGLGDVLRMTRSRQSLVVLGLRRGR
jgi:NAD+ kinase